MMPRLKKHFHPAAILSIILATFAVYRPSLQNQFVWDDTALILRDPFIRSWRLIPEGFRHFLFTDATASNFYRPIQRLTYTFDYALYAFRPCGYHLTSIILHAAAAVALFLCAEKLITRISPAGTQKSAFLAWLGAFAWAIHPVHSAAVCYVAGRADVLAALFGFSALFFAFRTPRGESSRFNDWAAAICFLLAMLSKESGVTALIIWMVALPFFYDTKKLLRWSIFAASIIAVYCCMRFSAEKIAPPPQPSTSFAARPILMARAWAEYAGLLVAPVDLHMERSVLAIDRGDMAQTVKDATLRGYQTLLGLALIVAFAAWWRWARRRLPAAGFFLVAFLIAYLPVSNLFTLNANAAEHWLYFNSAFLFVAAALSLNAVPVSGGLIAGIAALWLGYLGARTVMRNYDWKDQRTFLMSTIRDGGASPRMLINLGTLESSEGLRSESRQKIAIGYFNEALQQSPDQPFGLLGLATAQIRLHDYVNARTALEQALKIPFVHTVALQNLAILEYQQKGVDRIDLLRKAAELDPDNWEIQKRYITHLAERSEIPEAIRVLRQVLDRQPWRAESWQLLGDLLTKVNQGQLANDAYAWAADYDVHHGQEKTGSPAGRN